MALFAFDLNEIEDDFDSEIVSIDEDTTHAETPLYDLPNFADGFYLTTYAGETTGDPALIFEGDAAPVVKVLRGESEHTLPTYQEFTGGHPVRRPPTG